MPVPSLQPQTPEGLALASLWAIVLDLSLALMAAFWIANALAPPQDLPWKPLRLIDPPGLATDMKFRKAVGDSRLCRAVLAEGGVRIAEVAPRTDGACAQLNAVRVLGGVTPLQPASPVMTCPQALAYAFWDRHDLRPAAREVLGTTPSAVSHYGTYSCRSIAGRDRLSEHAFANALDVAAVRFADGRQVSVLRDFMREDEAGVFWRRIRTGACRWFRATLSPDYNDAHRDHLHLDSGRYGICR